MRIQTFNGGQRSRTFRFGFLVLVLLNISCPPHCLASGPDAVLDGTNTRTQWAVLIGVEKYHRASPLRFTVNDVEQLAQTLTNYGGISPQHILRMTDKAQNPKCQPLRASIQKELSEWLKKPEPNDQLLVYFSGHGYRDENGKLYLAPIDCDPENPAATGIPIEWFHKVIRECRATVKLLVLDACHAGSEKGQGEGTGVSADELCRSFENSDVLTLASSSAEQQSQIWDDKQQSLFSYWLNYGLKGHADKDGDGAVDVDELFGFVEGGVTRTAAARFPKAQRPVRIVHPDPVGVPVVLRMKPQPLRSVLADMAEQFADALADRQLKRVGALQFTNRTPLGELVAANFGALGLWCRDELERQLVEFGAQRYSVIGGQSLQAAVEAEKLGAAQLGLPTALANLSRRVGGLPVVAVGTLCGRDRATVSLQCKLIQTETQETVMSVAGVAIINDSQWAMMGGSAEIPSAVYQSDLDSGENASQVSASNQIVAKLDQLAKKPHPMLNKNFPYRVKIMIGGTEREGIFRGNEMFVPVRVGEVYQVWIENRSGRIVLMRLLVDGLNTLPEKPQKGVRTDQVAARVNLDQARHFVLDPAISKTMYVAGFVTQTGSRGEVREFKIVDAEKSLAAARRQFTDNLGLITVAFYAEAGGTRGGLGTDLGDKREEDLTERAGTKVGNLLGVVNIRYVDAAALNDR